MDWQSRRRWMNLAKGTACLAIGLLAVLTIGWVGDALGMDAQSSADAQAGVQEGTASAVGEVGFAQLSAFVLDGNEDAVGTCTVPESFLAECFDPSELGEVRCSFDGNVVGIVADSGKDDLLDACISRLRAGGWAEVESGQAYRSTFVKEDGDMRWLFLDVSQVSDSSVAVITLKGQQ